MKRSNVDVFGTLVLAILAVCVSARTQSVDPRIAEAQADFEHEFVKGVTVIQDKYRKALESHLRSFAQSGDLDSAKEASAELKAAKSWHSIPRVYGERALRNEPLQNLRQNYEAALQQAIAPIIFRHAQRLESLKRVFTQGGNLNDATIIDEELKRLKQGESIPVEAGARMHFSRFDKNEFAQWITEITVRFTGVFSGETFLTFDGKEVTYTSENKTLQYGYTIAGPRTVEFSNGGWRLDFSKDLHSGNFQTRDNSYEIQVLFERDQDPLPESASAR